MVEILVGAEWIQVPLVKPGESVSGRWLHLELLPEREGQAWRKVLP
jgi:hypothetical protein